MTLITERMPTRRIVCMLAAAVLLSACTTAPKSEQPALRKLTIGIQTSPAMALVMVAKDNGLFEKEGLDVELKEFTAGKFALQAFLGGSLDFAVAGEVPCTLALMQGSRFSMLSQVVERTVNEVRVVAHSEPGITDAGVYFKKKKRKLATSLGGGPEFFTYSFLKKHNIGPNAVEIISQKPEDMPAALASKSVDAISIFDPFAWIGTQQLKGEATVFTEPDIYSELYVITVKSEFLQANPEVADKLLRALVEARKAIESQPAEAKQIVAKYTKLAPDVVEAVWKSFIFAPALTQQLVDYQTRQGAWAKETGKVAGDAVVPDFRKAIEDGPLRRVAPDAVKL